MQSPRNRCGFLMLVKLRQAEGAQGFVLFMYKLLEMLDKVMEFLLPPGSAVYGNSFRLLPVHACNPLVRMRGCQRRGSSWDLSCMGRTRYLNPARRSSPWSPFSE
ncbi:MAG: hypothetical protein RL042_920 [Nitrospirota bacterium]|jgi:hypothetical protein